MRIWFLAFGAIGVAAAILGQPKPARSWTIVIGGDVAGYLSPCGCTYPMSGGIRRWATEVRTRMANGPTLVLENGGFVSGSGAQDRFKAEALAEALGQTKAAAINLTASEALFGPGELSQLSQLAHASFVASQLKPNAEIGLRRFVARNIFLIGGAVQTPASLASIGGASGSPVEVAKELVNDAKADGLVPILMLEADEQTAIEIAQSVPALRLVVFTRSGDPLEQERTVGNTMLVTPGEQGKYLVQLTYSNGHFLGYSTERLWPSVKDDPAVSKIYAAYLRTVEREHLLDSWPRRATDSYAGAAKCGSCHAEAYSIWKGSKHRGSFSDLKAQGHGADPDCVACHVTGLSSEQGFRGLLRTPDLAYVGCESCHGPGAAHAAHPYGTKMAKTGKESCVSCHDPENSPHFDYLTYWNQIQHR